MKGKGSSKPKVVAKPPPAPTKWRIDSASAKKIGQTTGAGLTNVNSWIKAVHDGKHPKEAAKAWDSDYEILHTKSLEVEGKKGVAVNCCSIRLAEGNRVYFYQIDSVKLVKVLRYGDHKEPSW